MKMFCASTAFGTAGYQGSHFQRPSLSSQMSFSAEIYPDTGRLFSPVNKIMSGCKSQLLKHVVSHRRQLYMILNKRNEELNLRFIVKVDDYEYVIFATSSVMKCFACGEEGHAVRACPETRGSESDWSGGD